MTDFTSVYKQTICKVSPDSGLLAVIVNYKLIIRTIPSLEILKIYSFTANIKKITWSADSKLIACQGNNSIQIWDCYSDWGCRIDEGLAGVVDILFPPDSRCLLSFSDFKLRITIWDLTTKSASYMQYPKYDDQRGYAFRCDGKYFALLERKSCKDAISIYDIEDWTMVKHFPIDCEDADSIDWSPDGRFISVRESNLQFKLLIYYPDGRHVATFQNEKVVLGIKSLKWSPSGQFICLGGFDEKIRLLNHYTWKPLIEFSHPSSVDAHDIICYNEVAGSSTKDEANWEYNSERSRIRYEITTPPMNIRKVAVQIDKLYPKVGVGILEFSSTGRWLCSKNDNMPNYIWVWDLLKLRHHAIIKQLSTSYVRKISWNPVFPDLFAFCCGVGTIGKAVSTLSLENKELGMVELDNGVGGYIYLWNGDERGVEAIEIVHENFQVLDFQWSSDGMFLNVMDKDTFCLAFPIPI